MPKKIVKKTSVKPKPADKPYPIGKPPGPVNA